MNWKIIFQLSMFGLIMAFGTLSLIPDSIEPVFWIVIFIVVGYLIAKICNNKYFAYGFMVSVFNSVWITAVHILFYNLYAVHHTSLVKLMPFKNHIVLSLLLTGAVSAVVFGLLQGLFALIAGKLVKKEVAPEG